MSDLASFRTWMSQNSGNLEHLLSAASNLIDALVPKAQAQGMNVQDLVNDDMVTVRALADGVGLAEIAGAHGVTPEDVLGALVQVLKITTLVTAIF